MWLYSIEIVMGAAGGVTPTPADGDAAVEEVADLVVLDLVVRGLAEPNSVAAVEDAPPVVDEAVVDFVPFGPLLGTVGETRLAQPHAARAEVVQMALDDAVLLRAAFQPEAVTAGAGDLAALERAVPRAAGENGCFLEKGHRLAVHPPALWHVPVGVLKGKALEVEAFDEPVRPPARPQDATIPPIAAQSLPPWSCPRPAADSSSAGRSCGRGRTRRARRAPRGRSPRRTALCPTSPSAKRWGCGSGPHAARGRATRSSGAKSSRRDRRRPRRRPGRPTA